MPVTSHSRGHLIRYDTTRQAWRYVSDEQLVGHLERPCVRCGHVATVEGYDACLGQLRGVRAACCGHGVERGFCLPEHP